MQSPQFKTYPHSPQLSKLQACALILIKLHHFENLGLDPNSFVYKPEEYVPALQTLFDICDRFREQDNERGFPTFLEQLESCNKGMDAVLDWRGQGGFMNPYVSLGDLDRCSEKINIVGLLDSLPRITVDPDADRYKEQDDSTVTFAEKFAKENLSRLLKHQTVFAES